MNKRISHFSNLYHVNFLIPFLLYTGYMNNIFLPLFVSIIIFLIASINWKYNTKDVHLLFIHGFLPGKVIRLLSNFIFTYFLNNHFIHIFTIFHWFVTNEVFLMVTDVSSHSFFETSCSILGTVALIATGVNGKLTAEVSSSPRSFARDTHESHRDPTRAPVRSAKMQRHGVMLPRPVFAVWRFIVNNFRHARGWVVTQDEEEDLNMIRSRRTISVDSRWILCLAAVFLVVPGGLDHVTGMCIRWISGKYTADLYANSSYSDYHWKNRMNCWKHVSRLNSSDIFSC